MKEEPFFLRNEFLEKEKKELEKILEVVHGKNAKNVERAVFLRNFTNEIFKVYRKTKKPKIEEKKQLEGEKQLLLKKKQELLNKLQQLEQPQQSKKIIETKGPEVIQAKDIILSKETGKPLVKTEFDGTKYLVIEPELNQNDISLINEFKKSVRNIDNKDKFTEQLKLLSAKYNIIYSDEYYDKTRYYIIRDTMKFGKISPLIEDKDVIEIVCDGVNKPITIQYKEKEDVQTNISFSSEDELNNFLFNVAKKLNQKVSVENPFLNLTIEKLNIQGTMGSEFVKAKFVITKI